ncbi:MAG: flagellar motor protein MotB [Desulfococcaceae bacterium]
MPHAIESTNPDRVGNAMDRMLPLLLTVMALLAAMVSMDLKTIRAKASEPVPAPSAPDAAVPELADLEGVQSRKTCEGIAIALSETVLFRSGRAGLEDRGRPVLARVAEAVETLAGRVRVEGHTDDRPIRHSAFSSNYALSLARAHAVARFLVETGRISPGRIGAVGFGADRPAVPNDSAAGRSANRRVEIIVLTEGTASHE